MKATGKILLFLFLLPVSCVPAKEYIFDLERFVINEEQDFMEKNNFILQQLLDYRNWEACNYFRAEGEKKLELQLKEYYWSLLETNRLYLDRDKQIISFSRSYFFPETETYFYISETVDGKTFLHLYIDPDRTRYNRSIEAETTYNHIKITDGKNRFYYKPDKEKDNE